MHIIERLVAVFAPHCCVGCRTEGALLCTECVASLPAIVPRCYRCQRITKAYRTCPACRASSDLYVVRPRTLYTATAKALVYSLKYERARAAAVDIAKAIAAQGRLNGEFIISHVPTAPTRVRQRGYDQAALIARELARQTGYAYTPLLVRRTEERQVGQKRATRHAQMRDAFRMRRRLPARQHILLVDDVLTTGATCEAAARTLKQAGAWRVSAVVFAAA